MDGNREAGTTRGKKKRTSKRTAQKTKPLQTREKLNGWRRT